MADIELLPRLRFAGGLRIESTQQNVDPVDIFQSSLDPLTGAALDDTDLLPGATLTWGLNEAMNLRFAGSRTLARPEFRELAPFSFADFAGGYLRVGNPTLMRSRITNLDARWEWFPSPGAVFAVSAFYKNFTDPIEEVVYPSTEFIASWTNADGAENIGTELEVRSALGFLTESLENLAVNVNLTLVDSEVDTGTEATVWVPGVGAVPIEIVPRLRRLQGQSPYVINAGVNWFVPSTNTALTILYNRFGDRIAQVGTQFLPDVIEEPRDQLDVVLQQPITDRVDVKVAAEDILASRVEFTQGGDPLRGWTPGRVFKLQLSWQPTGQPQR
ncbi:MAG: TonB-dependent receptor [Gemmatimonadota bacterium]|nr:TonB-dependent receptor [Gemmatimonadota bacterium]